MNSGRRKTSLAPRPPDDRLSQLQGLTSTTTTLLINHIRRRPHLTRENGNVVIIVHLIQTPANARVALLCFASISCPSIRLLLLLVTELGLELTEEAVTLLLLVCGGRARGGCTLWGAAARRGCR